VTLKFNSVLAIVKIHVHAKISPTKYSGSLIIVLAQKTTNKLSVDAETILSSLLRTVSMLQLKKFGGWFRGVAVTRLI